MVTALIQAVLMVFQVASTNPEVSTTMGTKVYGGLLQSPIPTRGNVSCPATTAMSTEAPAFAT